MLTKVPEGSNTRAYYRRLRAIDAEFSTAYIKNATIVDATITNADIDSLSFDKITSGDNPNDLQLSGSLELLSGGVFKTGDSGEYIEINGATGQITFSADASEQVNPALITADNILSTEGYLSLRGPVLGDGILGSDFGYGLLNLSSSELSAKGSVYLQALGDGSWDSEWFGIATALDTGDAQVYLSALADSGDSDITLNSQSTSGTGTMNLIADEISLTGKIDIGGQGIYDGSTRIAVFSNPSGSIGRLVLGTETNDYIEMDGSSEAWKFYIDSNLEFDLTGSRCNIPNVYSDTVGSTQNVHVDSNGRLRRSTSSLKYKQGWFHVELADLEIPRPIKWWDKEGQRWRVGFGAEHIEEALPFAAEHENYDIRALVAVLAAKVTALEARVKELEDRV